MKRLILSLILAPSLALGFNDVPANHSQNQAINFMQQQGYVEGYPDGTFRPNSNINRAEFLKIVYLVNKQDFPQHFEDSMCIYIMNYCDPDVEQCFPFSDVKVTDWHASYVCHGTSQGFVNGYPDGTFHPEKNINFAESAKVLANLFELNKDIPETQIWYENDIQGLEAKGAKPNSIKTPRHFITRGEMAEMIYKLKQN